MDTSDGFIYIIILLFRFNNSNLPEEIDLNEFLQRWNEIEDIGNIEENYVSKIKHTTLYTNQIKLQ
jgi:hypothetical protein